MARSGEDSIAGCVLFVSDRDNDARSAATQFSRRPMMFQMR